MQPWWNIVILDAEACETRSEGARADAAGRWSARWVRSGGCSSTGLGHGTDRQADQKKNRRTEGRWKDRHTNHVNGAALPTMLAKLSAIPQSIAGMLAVPKCRCCVRHPPVVRRRVVRSPGPPSLWCGWPPEASATGHRRRVVSAATLNDTTGTQVWVTSRAALLLHL